MNAVKTAGRSMAIFRSGEQGIARHGRFFPCILRSVRVGSSREPSERKLRNSLDRLKLFPQILLIAVICGTGILLAKLPSLVYRLRSEPSPAIIGISPGGETASILGVLSTIRDPELDLTLIELGLVRSIHLEEDGKAKIAIILTTPYCPLASVIVSEIRDRVLQMEGIREVEVNVDRRTLWSQDLMTEEGREKLKGLFR